MNKKQTKTLGRIFEKPERADIAWNDIEKREIGSYANMGMVFTQGSRQVFDVVFEVSQSRSGWDGVFGCVVVYDSGAGNKRADVNSKVFVGDSGHAPFTFKTRRLHSSTAVKPLAPGKEDSQTEAT